MDAIAPTSRRRAPEADPGFPGDLLLDLGAAEGVGLRERLEHALRAAIQSRRLAAGAPLPPTRVLAAELGVSRTVVVEAYGNLAADGYLEARRGAGTRVRPDVHQGDRPALERPAFDERTFFERPRPPALLATASIRLLGGLPDPALFPRARWLRHYRAALTDLPDPEFSYPGGRGAAPLRAALATYLGRVRGIAASDVVVCGGFTQGLTLLCRVLARSGATRLAVEDPCFGLHRQTIRMAGLEPVPLPTDADGIDVAALDAHDVGAVLVAPAHSYPSGCTLSAERRRALLAWARRNDALIIEDDYDAEFRYDRVPIGALQGLAPDHVAYYVGTASKTVTPALRLGWIVAPAHLLEALEREKLADDMGSGLLEQLTFARFVASGDFARFLRRVRPIYRDRRDAALQAVEQLLPGVRCEGVAAGLHLHALLPGDVDERALALAAFRRGVLVEDAAWHWHDPAQAPPALIIGYGQLSVPTLLRALTVLGEERDRLAG
jgi:GntR family transcriptional regulator/MocR family aminotransferase